MKKWISSILAVSVILSAVAASAGMAETVYEEETEYSTEAQGDAEEGAVSKETITRAGSWEDIYTALSEARNNYYYYDEVVDYAIEDTTSYGVESKAAAVDNVSSDTDYSDTNLRDSRVDEGDIIKTDGTYIYILQEEKYLTIVRADGADSEVVSKTQIIPEGTGGVSDEEVLLADHTDTVSIIPKEMFVDGDRLVMILSERRCKEGSSYSWDTDTYVVTAAFDISDRAKPVSLGDVSQEGYYQQSRRMNGVTYVYTNDWPELGTDADDSDLMVHVGEEELSPDAFYIPKIVIDQSYLIFASIEDENPSQVVDAGVFVSGGEQYYVSENSLYCLNGYWSNSGSKTQITRFSLEDGQFVGKASCILPGYVNNSWSIDEYDNHLRVLLTYTGIDGFDFLENLLWGDSLTEALYGSRSVRKNALYVLDEKLEKVSRIGDIAKNEEIRSARFMGDTAYFVTYENTDPLFSLDLSDSKQPKLLGELKITGFSSYLHPFGEGRLLGIGYETDPETGETLGLKLTMFDTSDKKDLKVLYTEVISGITYCPAIENYKSILAAPEKGLIGFFYDDRYLLYHYEEGGGFTSEKVYDLLSVGLAGVSTPNTMRGLYIGDIFYMAGSTYVAGFPLNDINENFLIRM